MIAKAKKPPPKEERPLCVHCRKPLKPITVTEVFLEDHWARRSMTTTSWQHALPENKRFRWDERWQGFPVQVRRKDGSIGEIPMHCTMTCAAKHAEGMCRALLNGEVLELSSALETIWNRGRQ